MKKKILLLVSLFALLACIFAVAVSAEEMTVYGQYKVLIEGNSEYTTAYSSVTDLYTPTLEFTKGVYTAPNNDSAYLIDKAKIVEIDISETVLTGTIDPNLERTTALSSNDAFGEFSKLVKFVYPNTGFFNTIAVSMFRECTALRDVDFGSIQYVHDYAFAYCAFETLDVPTTVHSFNDNAFLGCANLKSITLSPSKLGNNCFQKCTSLESADISGGTLTYAGSIFNETTALKYVKLPNTIETMAATFKSCSSLEAIEIPASVTTLKYSVFEGCTSLASITFPENSNLTAIEGANFQKTIVTELRFPNSLTTVTGALVNNASMLETIYFGANLQTIGAISFAGCKSLKNVYLSSEFYKEGVEMGDERFTYGINDAPNNIVWHYVGTKAQAEALVAKAAQTSENNKISDAVIISLEEYTQNGTEAAYTIVYGYNLCEVFYNNQHKETLEITKTWIDKDGNPGEAFLSYFKVACPCGRSCGVETVIDTLAPLFVDRGFAYGPNSMLQGVAVDRELLDEYGNYFTGIKYGLVAAAKSAQASASIIDANGVGANGYVAAVDYTERDYDLFEMNLYGISEDYQATEFYFGAYVIADGQVYYIHNGTTNNEAQAIAYDDVVMIVDALVPEKEEE